MSNASSIPTMTLKKVDMMFLLKSKDDQDYPLMGVYT